MILSYNFQKLFFVQLEGKIHMKKSSSLKIFKLQKTLFSSLLLINSFFIVSESFATPSTCTTSLCNCSIVDGSCYSSSDTTCYNKKSEIQESCGTWCSNLETSKC
jgi:hypothetical protein